jgi:hypothetical protein
MLYSIAPSRISRHIDFFAAAIGHDGEHADLAVVVITLSRMIRVVLLRFF